MAGVVFIGDEVTAQGFRLAGAGIRVPVKDGVAASFGDALREADLVLITADAAVRLDADVLENAVRAASPLVLVIPDAAFRTMPPDPADAIDRVLGIAP